MGLNNNRDPTSLLHFKVDSVEVSRLPPPVTISYSPAKTYFQQSFTGEMGLTKIKLLT